MLEPVGACSRWGRPWSLETIPFRGSHRHHRRRDCHRLLRAGLRQPSMEPIHCRSSQPAEKGACAVGIVSGERRDPPDVSVHGNEPGVGAGCSAMSRGSGHAQSGSAGAKAARERCMGEVLRPEACALGGLGSEDEHARRLRDASGEMQRQGESGGVVSISSSVYLRVCVVYLRCIFSRCIFACIFVSRRGRNLEAWRAVTSTTPAI